MWRMWNGGSLRWHLEWVQPWLICRKKLSEFHLTTASVHTVRSRLRQCEKHLCISRKVLKSGFEKCLRFLSFGPFDFIDFIRLLLPSLLESNLLQVSNYMAQRSTKRVKKKFYFKSLRQHQAFWRGKSDISRHNSVWHAFSYYCCLILEKHTT